MTTYYTKLKFHLERHMYKRGANKGDAPMGRRGKTHYRVIDRGTHMAVRLHYTDILQAYPDGNITIDCNGWADRITTKTHLNEAMPRDMWIGSTKFRSESQLCITTQAGRYYYYDGITFDANGKPTTELRPFKARRIDKDEVAELNRALLDGGFKDMFKMLWAACEYEDTKIDYSNPQRQWQWVRNKLALFELPEVHADKWRHMIAVFAFKETWDRDPRTGMHRQTGHKLDPSTTWSNIMRWAKKDMYQSVETEVYEISK